MRPAQFRKLFREFDSPSWAAWNAVEDAIHGQPLDDAGRALFAKVSGGRRPPGRQVSEFWAVAGRGGGKSRVVARLAAYHACGREHRRTAGESLYVGVFGPDRRQAAVTLRYITGLIDSVPELRALVVRRTAESLELSSGIVIEVLTASTASPRGRSYVLAIVEEAAFLSSDEYSADPDRELLRAVRPALARVPGSLLCVVSSPYAARGVLHDTWRDYFGRDDDDVLVIQAATSDVNPAFDQRAVERARRDDPVAAASEYDAQFRSNVSGVFDLGALEALTSRDVTERQPQGGPGVAVLDMSTGSGADAAALAIAEARDDGTAVLLATRHWRPPFSPSDIVAEVAGLLRRYDIGVVWVDRYAPGLVADMFARHDIAAVVQAQDTSAVYIELVALINSGAVLLLDDETLRGQLAGLVRRPRASVGRDAVDHRPGQHDDLAAAVAGALVAAAREAGVPALRLVDTSPEPPALARSDDEQAFDGDDASGAVDALEDEAETHDPLAPGGPAWSSFTRLRQLGSSAVAQWQASRDARRRRAEGAAERRQADATGKRERREAELRQRAEREVDEARARVAADQLERLRRRSPLGAFFPGDWR